MLIFHKLLEVEKFIALKNEIDQTVMSKVRECYSRPKFYLLLDSYTINSTQPVVYFDQRLGAAHSKRWSK